MEADKQSLEKLYAGMSTDELLAIKPDTLTENAKLALSAEIAKRDIAPEEQSEIQGAIQNARPFKESAYKEFHKEVIIAAVMVVLSCTVASLFSMAGRQYFGLVVACIFLFVGRHFLRKKFIRR